MGQFQSAFLLIKCNGLSLESYVNLIFRYHLDFPTYFVSFNLFSVEYQDQTSCLVDHLKSCLTGLFAGFVPAVTSLIKLLLYHCGDLKVDPALIDQFLLNQIQCKGSVFAQTVECWNDFRERLNRDKTDPKLCRYKTHFYQLILNLNCGVLSKQRFIGDGQLSQAWAFKLYITTCMYFPLTRSVEKNCLC